MTSPDAEIPETNDKSPTVIVYEPVIVPLFFVTVPVALMLAPKSATSPFALKDQLLASVYDPERSTGVPAIVNEPVPVSPALGLHDMASELTDIPETTETVPMVIVNDPETVPLVLVIEPDAATEVPKIVSEPLALKVQDEVFV